jgi:membrane-associated protease RseP (regulator of RpoE activity)
MKRFAILTILAAFILTPAALAKDGDKRGRTVIVRDGRVMDVDEWDLTAGKRAFLGVSPVDLTADLREHYTTRDSGILVGEVEDNSPAQKAGLQVGDIIVSIDGKDIVSSSDLRRTLRGKKDGDTARIDILRGKNRQTVVATLVERDFGGMFRGGDFDALQKRLTTTFNSPEWRASVERLGRTDCVELQTRIKDLETRLKDLEKKLK